MRTITITIMIMILINGVLFIVHLSWTLWGTWVPSDMAARYSYIHTWCLKGTCEPSDYIGITRPMLWTPPVSQDYQRTLSLNDTTQSIRESVSAQVPYGPITALSYYQSSL